MHVRTMYMCVCTAFGLLRFFRMRGRRLEIRAGYMYICVRGLFSFYSIYLYISTI